MTGMFKNPEFQQHSAVDKRGRKVEKRRNQENMRKYYKLKDEVRLYAPHPKMLHRHQASVGMPQGVVRCAAFCGPPSLGLIHPARQLLQKFEVLCRMRGGRMQQSRVCRQHRHSYQMMPASSWTQQKPEWN